MESADSKDWNTLDDWVPVRANCLIRIRSGIDGKRDVPEMGGEAARASIDEKEDAYAYAT